MKKYTKEELEEAFRAIASTIGKCEKAQPKLKQGTAQHTLLLRRIKAFRIALDLLAKEVDSPKAVSKGMPLETAPCNSDSVETEEQDIQLDLLNHLDRLHTTELGDMRIRNNLGLETTDTIAWCKQKIEKADAITKKGKNWYVRVGNIVLTINAHSFTIITVHRKK